MFLCPPKILKIFGCPLICLAMFVVLGGHWAVLQGIAWSQMVVSYSQSAQSLSAGLEQTFSGKYPCAMCKNIAEAKQKEEPRPAAANSAKKVEVFVAATRSLAVIPLPEKFSYPAVADSRFPSRSDQPPQPVPILA